MPKKVKQTKQKVDEESSEEWKDDDKSLLKKQRRKEESLKKKEQQIAKKAEAKKLLQEEETSLKCGKAPKVTRAQIRSKLTVKEENTKKEIEENTNKVVEEVARSVDEAISLFEEKSLDKHPEKRRKAAFTAHETRRIKELREENPSLKLSQIKEMVFKEWQKSSENPMNQQDI